MGGSDHEVQDLRQYQFATFDSFLYLILRKASLGIQVTNSELKWLAEKRLLLTIEVISLQQYQAKDRKRLEAEFLELRTKYCIPQDSELPLSSPIYPILWKVDAECTLEDSEIKLLNDYGFSDTATLIKSILGFSKLKVKYGATEHINSFPEEPLYSILKKLDAKEQLAEVETDWLVEHNFKKPLEIHWQQENKRKADLEFLDLKSKYQVGSHPDVSASSALYPILKKLKAKQALDSGECKWLEQQKLIRLLEIDQERKKRKTFLELKQKYKATEYQNSDPSDLLFKVLGKLEWSQAKLLASFSDRKSLLSKPENQVSENDIQWLTENSLTETSKVAQQVHFRILKAKYQIVGELAIAPFYEIMLKLEREERLDPKQVIQLIEENRLSPHGKIAIAHYRLEAKFYEEEYKRTGNKWNLPTASSSWRKAEKPKEALRVTENLNWNKVQEAGLKAALLVTRGAAFRDLERLAEAEDCAAKAMECQPGSHQPYTLMGAISYDRREYAEGDKWFEMAAERGADDPDNEIEKVVRMTKDQKKRKEAAEYLLAKDSKRYAWANSYLN